MGRDKLGAWDLHICTTVYKQINNKDLLYRTGNYQYIQYLVTPYNEKESERDYATAKSLQSCLTLCDPIPGILQARTLEWVAISFSNA